MKFYAYCCQKDLSDNNGGSLVLAHHLHALEELGHESGGLLNLTEPVPKDADFIMHQSEWWNVIKPHLNNSKAKRICWLGHFYPSLVYGYPPIKEIKAAYYHTQWKGEAVEKAKKELGIGIYYLPHAGCSKCNTEGIQTDAPKVVIIRNKFKERAEDWIDYAQVTAINAPFAKVKDIYKSATVCPNLHGDFQKNIRCDFFTVPAFMINERLFQVILSGGFAISDNNPIVKEFFSEDEIPYCETKEIYKEKIKYFRDNPEARIPYMERAKARILKEHLYTIRLKGFLETL